MNIVRHEIRTGLLVLLSLSALVAVLVYLGAPGAFIAQNKYFIYFDNAVGIKPGAAVLLAGRKIGQVRSLYSPVPEKDRPEPNLETLIEVQVEATAKIYRKVKVQMTQTSVLGDSVIDFTNGDESSGLAPTGSKFVGQRPGGLADAVPAILNKLDPVLMKVTSTLNSLQAATNNLTKITSEGADLPVAFLELRKFGGNLDDLTSPAGPLYHALNNVEALSGENGKIAQSFEHLSILTSPESSLSKTLDNTEKFTANLSNNRDIDATLRNFRAASEDLNRTLARLSAQFSAVGDNLEQATDTVKRQPWRLIWPTTKKYPAEGEASPTPKPIRGKREKSPNRDQ
jgi:ABC-type transporter Mla subunit MlaD